MQSICSDWSCFWYCLTQIEERQWVSIRNGIFCEFIWFHVLFKRLGSSCLCTKIWASIFWMRMEAYGLAKFRNLSFGLSSVRKTSVSQYMRVQRFERHRKVPYCHCTLLNNSSFIWIHLILKRGAPIFREGNEIFFWMKMDSFVLASARTHIVCSCTNV